MFKRFHTASVFVAIGFACASAHAQRDCDINGEAVNTYSGASYAGKTGIMKCRDRASGKIVLEEEYRNGRAVGYRKMIDYQGHTQIGTYNEQGNRDGDFREYDREGRLISEERYANGQNAGVQVHYHPNGKVRRRSFAEPGKGTLASLEYNDRGELAQLRCADRPLLGDDRKLCGFDGSFEATLHDAKGEVAARVRHDNGKRVSLAIVSRGGAVARSEETHGERRVVREHFPEGELKLETTLVGNRREGERELAKNGRVVRETRWQDGRKIEEALWYMNGQPRSKTRWEREGRQTTVRSEEFWDNGTLRERSVRDERRGYIGVQQRYDENGAVATEDTYDAGKLVARKVYKDGRLVLDEQYWEDGSRKSARKAD